MIPILALVFVILCILVGVVAVVHSAVSMAEKLDTYEDRRGWIYFISAVGDPDAPIKVGMCHRDPTAERLPELRTMSPYPLRIIHKFPVSDRYEYEAKVHKILHDHRQHGEWFDRDATLAFIEHIKGAA